MVYVATVVFVDLPTEKRNPMVTVSSVPSGSALGPRFSRAVA